MPTLVIMTFFSLIPMQDFDWLSFTMIKRSYAQGKTTTVEGKVHIDQSGKMLTLFRNPQEIYILNNKDGELQVYNKNENSVYNSFNYRMGSHNTTFYYFLFQKPDMGLDELGFTLVESSVQDMMLVSKWTPPSSLASQILYIELVSNGEHPVFMGYIDHQEAYTKKVYYYDFQEVRGIPFPKSQTEIDFIRGDSTITKTTFTGFAFDAPEDREMLDFQIPENAIPIK